MSFASYRFPSGYFTIRHAYSNLVLDVGTSPVVSLISLNISHPLPSDRLINVWEQDGGAVFLNAREPPMYRYDNQLWKCDADEELPEGVCMLVNKKAESILVVNFHGNEGKIMPGTMLRQTKKQRLSEEDAYWWKFDSKTGALTCYNFAHLCATGRNGMFYPLNEVVVDAIPSPTSNGECNKGMWVFDEVLSLEISGEGKRKEI